MNKLFRNRKEVDVIEAATQTSHDVEIRVISPGDAAEMLGRNTHNRNVRPRYVEQLAGAIARGEWRFNGDAIKFDLDGQLQDGQHRLHAVVKAGVPIECLVIEGLAPEAQETMDIGAKRNLADTLRLRGYKETNKLAAAARLIWAYRYRQTMQVTHPQPTNAQILNVILAEPGLAEAVRLSSPVRRQGILVPDSVAAAVFHLAYEQDPEETEVFFERFAYGTSLEPGDPIYALRKQFIGRLPHQRKFQSHHAAALMIKAFNAWRDGTTLRNLSWKRGGSLKESFPLINPSDTAEEAA